MREWLKERRMLKEMTQQELADLIGVDVTSIGKYELGQRRPSPEVAQEIGALLDFDWTEFFKEKVEV